MVRFRKPTDRERAWLAAIPGIGFYIALEQVMQEERALLIAACMYVFYAVIDAMWERRHQRSFWAAVSALAVIHAAILGVVAIPHFTGPTLTIVGPFMFADGFALWMILKWVGKQFPVVR